jgi:hypothetical protein
MRYEKKVKRICKTCGKESLLTRTIIYQKTSGNCLSCSSKGNKSHLGLKCSEETKHKMSLAKIGLRKSPEHCLHISESKKGDKHYRWIQDRAVYLKNRENDPEKIGLLYKSWRKQCCDRDNWKCKIGNGDCNGRLEVHHILGFTEHPELRYDINNGITLCHAHHPRKRAEEAKLSPFFQTLVAEMK